MGFNWPDDYWGLDYATTVARMAVDELDDMGLIPALDKNVPVEYNSGVTTKDKE